MIKIPRTYQSTTVKKIFGIGESDYIDFKDLSEDKIKYLAEEYSDKNIAANLSILCQLRMILKNHT